MLINAILIALHLIALTSAMYSVYCTARYHLTNSEEVLSYREILKLERYDRHSDLFLYIAIITYVVYAFAINWFY